MTAGRSGRACSRTRSTSLIPRAASRFRPIRFGMSRRFAATRRPPLDIIANALPRVLVVCSQHVVRNSLETASTKPSKHTCAPSACYLSPRRAARAAHYAARNEVVATKSWLQNYGRGWRTAGPPRPPRRRHSRYRRFGRRGRVGLPGDRTRLGNFATHSK